MKKHSFAILAVLLLVSVLFTACQSKWKVDPDKEKAPVVSSISTDTSASSTSAGTSDSSSSGSESSGTETSTSELYPEGLSDKKTIAITVVNLTEYKTGDIFVATFDMDAAAEAGTEAPGPYGHLKELESMTPVKITMDWPAESDELFFYLYNSAGERVLVTKQSGMSEVKESVMITIKFDENNELKINVDPK